MPDAPDAASPDLARLRVARAVLMRARMPAIDDSLVLAQGRLAQLLDGVIYKEVRDCIDLESLGDIEDHLAIELAHRDDLTDQQVLDLARGLVARALREIATSIERGGDRAAHAEASLRVDNARCLEAEAMVDGDAG